MNGHSLPWVNKMRYLGTFMISSRVFSFSFDQANRAYYRSLNAIFGKLGRFASEEVILQLAESKCLPLSRYGTEACCLKKSDINSSDFVVNCFFYEDKKQTTCQLLKTVVRISASSYPVHCLLQEKQASWTYKIVAIIICVKNC
jgi:hypothetical protein